MSNSIPKKEMRLIIVTIIVSVFVSQIADNFAKDMFIDFYSQGLVGKVIITLFYVVIVTIISIMILALLLKFFKLTK